MTLDKGIIGNAYRFEQGEQILLPEETFSEVTNSVSISFWQFGDEWEPFTARTVFTGVDSLNDIAILRLHLPSANGSTIMWGAPYIWRSK